MAATKTKNGQVVNDMTDAMNDAAAKATEDAKAMFDNMIEASNKMFADSKPIIENQQKFMQDGFAMWQEASQAYADFMLEAVQKGMDQSLAIRQQWFSAMESNAKKAEEIFAVEQNVALKMVETYQAQAKSAAEQLSKFYTPAKK